MDFSERGYEEIIQRFKTWSAGEENLRAAVVIGSRARTDHPADEWADLDLMMAVEDPEVYIRSATWVEHMGQPLLTFIERTGDQRNWERRVLFDGGLDVDFALIPAVMIREMLAQGIPPDVADIFQRGVRVLVDKDGLIAELQEKMQPPPPPEPPSPQEFMNSVQDFWYHTVWVAKHLRRAELWWAKSGCDNYLKGLLRQMLEWHARAMHGAEYDTWLRGRFLEEWADERAVQALPQVFAHYDRVDIRRALLATLELYSWVAQETAELLNYEYPHFGEGRARQLVELILPD